MREATSRTPAIVAVVVASVLAVGKLVAGILTGSLALVAAGVDNVLDVTCSGLNVFFLGLARKPPDEEHPFGHEKAEALSGVIQATIIAMGGLYLAGRSVWKLATGPEVTAAGPGVVVSLVSLVVSIALGLYLSREARRYASVALRADAFHYLTDIFTNSAAAVALLLVRFTGNQWWDPVGSLVISLYIVWESVGILREASDELLDRGLSAESERAVAEVIESLGPEVRGFSSLRTRGAGRTVFVELRLQVDRSVSFERSHDLSEELIERLRGKLGPSTQVMVDTDPV